MKPETLPANAALPARTSGNALQSLGRRLLLSQLRHLAEGEIRVLEGDAQHRFGRPSARCDLVANIRVANPQFFADAAFGGTVGAGESYMNGHWACDDLTALVRIMVVNRERMSTLEGGWAGLVSAPFLKLLHWVNRNSRSGSARNIAAHYDLGNELFELMLDDTMAYSCGLFPHPGATLREASTTKFDAICRKLDLKAGEHLLEIGTGWGGLAIHAAQNYGCRVTTTTISREQHHYARERISKAGLDGRVTLLLEDYRALTGTHDKLVSVEMIEAVGHQYLDTYFAKCSRLLAPHGAMLLQAITIRDQLYERALRSVDFIQRFIFPGSFIPSIRAMSDSIARATDFKLFHLEDIGPHYALTLRRWRENFFAAIDRVRALGYPERFIRMWEYYLCYCEGGFAERQLGDVHMLLTKPQCRRASLATLA